MKTRITLIATLAFTLCCLLVGSTGCQKQDTTTTDPAALVFDSVASEDGLMVRYDKRGVGDKTLLFVHCWCCDRTFWENQVDEFATDYTVITVDLAGHGESATGRETWTVAAFGADVAAVATKLDLSNVVLIGHSMGGPVCIEAARRLPGRVVGIIGVDNFQNFGETPTEAQIAGFRAQFEADFQGTTNTFTRGMFTPNADSALVDRIAGIMSSANPEMGIEAITNTVLYDYVSALAEVRLPIRTISGDRYLTNVESNQSVAESFEVRLMPGQGHFPHLEDPPEFNRLLRETLTDFWPTATE